MTPEPGLPLAFAISSPLLSLSASLLSIFIPTFFSTCYHLLCGLPWALGGCGGSLRSGVSNIVDPSHVKMIELHSAGPIFVTPLSFTRLTRLLID